MLSEPVIKLAVSLLFSLLTKSIVIIHLVPPQKQFLQIPTNWIILLLASGILCFFSAASYLHLIKDETGCVDHQNKAVIITGCDSGFGHSLALRLHKLGYTVYACCLFSQQKGAEELRKLGESRMHVLQVDVTNEDQIREATEYVKTSLGDTQLWALVNNAGIASYAEIEWCAVNVFQRIMDVNVIGVVRMTKSFLPLLRTTKGRVVNVASLSGRYTLPAFAAYSMSKVACIAFSDGLRQEMSKFGIKVITVEPGLYRTPIAVRMVADSKKRWDDTPTEIKDAYGEEYFAGFIDLINFQMTRARENVEEVVDLMIEAVTSTNPHIRYVPYWVTKIRSTILMHLPSVIRDKLFRLYSVRVEPKCMHGSSASPSPSI